MISILIPVHRINRKYKNGDIIYTNSGNCEIITIYSYSKVKIRFVDTGYETMTRMTELKTGKVKDMLKISVCGVGILGKDFNKIKQDDYSLYKKSYQVWIDMIKRCYDTKRPGYSNYGAKGIRVSERWLNFSNFYYDIQTLEGYDKEKFMNSDIFLDKDKLQLNKSHDKRVYSINTCVFLTREENNSLQDYASQLKEFIVVFPDGHEETHIGIRKFAKSHGMNFTNICACIKGTQLTYHGYKFKPIDKK